MSNTPNYLRSLQAPYCQFKLIYDLTDACSLEEKLDSLLKRRDITLSTKIHLVKAMIFPVVMYRCDELDNKEG